MAAMIKPYTKKMSGKLFETFGHGFRNVTAEISQKPKTISVPLGNGKEITLYKTEYNMPLELCTLAFTNKLQDVECLPGGNKKKGNITKISTKEQISGKVSNKGIHLLRKSRTGNSPENGNGTRNSALSGQQITVTKDEALHGLTKTIAYLEMCSNLNNHLTTLLWKVYAHIDRDNMDVEEHTISEFVMESGLKLVSAASSPLDKKPPQGATEKADQNNVVHDAFDLDSDVRSDVNASPGPVSSDLIETEPKFEDTGQEISLVLVEMSGTSEDVFFDDHISEDGYANVDQPVVKKTLKEFPKRKFTCDKCGKYFYVKHSYKAHMQMHAGLDPFQCTVCRKVYRSVHSLRSHMIFHSDKTFVCEKCGKVFKHPTRLYAHMRSHDAIRRHACPICGQRSALKGQHETHMRTHTDEKPYTCNICRTQFTRSNHLLKHNRRKHPELVTRLK